MNNAHPWRQRHSFVKHVARTRGHRFREYLATLAPEERRRIEAEELRFVAMREDPASAQMKASQDYGEILFAPGAV